MSKSNHNPSSKMSIIHILVLMVLAVAILILVFALIKSFTGPNAVNSTAPQGTELVSTNRPKSAVANATSRKSVDVSAHEMALEAELNNLGFTSVGANPISFEKTAEKIEKQ